MMCGRDWRVKAGDFFGASSAAFRTRVGNNRHYFGQRLRQSRPWRFDEQAPLLARHSCFRQREGQETGRRSAGGHQQRGPHHTSVTTHSPSFRALYARTHARPPARTPGSLDRSRRWRMRQPCSTTSLAAA